MARKSYRFAVIGFGGRGRHHVACAEGLPDVDARCVAVADSRTPTPEEKERFGSAFYPNSGELLAHEKDLDYVIVATPDEYHGEQALAALQRGLPVYLEKSVALTWQGAVELYRTVVANQYPLFVGYNLRRFPAAVALKEILDQGKLGQVQSLLAHVNTGNRWSRSVWERYAMPPSAGLIIGKLTHDTDTIQHCLGAEAVDCCATITRNIWPDKPRSVMGKGDVCSISGLLTNGVLYTVHLTTSGPDYERRYTVNGTGGQIEAILHTSRPGSPRASVTLWLENEEPHAIPLPDASGGHGGADPRTHADFIQWLQTGPAGPYDPRSILTGMVIPTAALDSVRTGQHIDCAERLAQAELPAGAAVRA